VSGDFFATLGVSPMMGRAIDSRDGVVNGPPVAVLSFGLSQGQFGGGQVVGTTVSLNSKSYQVIGVMPRGFGFPSESDVWIPMSLPTTFDTFSAFRGYLPTVVIARVAPLATLGSAEAQLMAAWTQRAAQEAAQPGPADYKWVGKSLQALKAKRALVPLKRELTGDRRTALLVLLGATLLLLLVTCANVTNLLLSQAAVRRHEIAVRAVLGASRGRVVRQLLTESIVLAVTGTAVGLLLAPAMLGTMRALLPAQLGGVAPATIDLRVLAFAATLSLVTGVLFGLWPAFGTSRSAPAETIKTGGRTATGRGASRARRMLVTAELALTIVLLVGSLLMLRSFDRLMSADRGMRTEEVATAEMAFSSVTSRYSVSQQKTTEILDRLKAMPGVTATGAVSDLPLGPVAGISVQAKPDVEPPAGTANIYPRLLQASGGYFAVMGISLKRGRVFTSADDSLAPRVAVISESMAKAFWPGVDAIGRTFSVMTPVTVIGVVADIRERNLQSDPGPQMYFPLTQGTPSRAAIVVRGSLPMVTLLTRIRDAVHAVDPSQAIYNLRPMDDVVASSVAPRRANTILISGFAGVALLLSLIGIYAVVSYNVTQRTREFGIRSALGATGTELVRLVTSEMGWVAGIGVAGGVAGAWALSKVLSSLIYGVTVHDPWSFAAAPLLLLVPAVIAAVIPARRATKVNPAEVMRAD
jgi:predicted permease